MFLFFVPIFSCFVLYGGLRFRPLNSWDSSIFLEPSSKVFVNIESTRFLYIPKDDVFRGNNSGGLIRSKYLKDVGYKFGYLLTCGFMRKNKNSSEASFPQI